MVEAIIISLLNSGRADPSIVTGQRLGEQVITIN